MKDRKRPEPISCEICGASSPAVWACGEYWIYHCDGCCHRFLPSVPPQVSDSWYGDEYFFGGGAGYRNYLDEEQVRRRHGRDYARLLARYLSPGSLLDIGAASGFLMSEFAASGWRVEGLEPNRSMAEYARTRLGLDVSAGTLECYSVDQRYTLLTMIQVIAHFANLQDALRNAARCTAEDGWWLIETWDFRSLMARGCGRSWHEYSPPTVRRWFSPASLILAAASHGMQLVARGRPRKYIQGAHARSLLQFRLEPSPFGRFLCPLLRWIPEAISIPYPFDDVFWMLFRQQSASGVGAMG